MSDKKPNPSLGTGRNRIALVDDHPAVLEGLTELINREDDLVVCATASNARDILKALDKRQVDLVIVDMLLKNTTGLQVTEHLRSRYPRLYILILSMSDAPHHVRGAFQAGARGYVTKDEVSGEIIVAIRQVLKGRIYASKKLVRKFPKRTIDNWLDPRS